MEFDSIDERFLAHRTGVGGALAQSLAIGLAGLLDVLGGDRREWDEVDGVDLDLTGADPIAASLLDPCAPPQPNRERDVSGQDVVA